MVLCLYEVWVWIICVDGRSTYLCIVLGGYLHIWGAPSVQLCCTLWISAFWHVFVYDRYHKSRLVCLKVVGPGLVSISPVFVSSSASHPVGPHDRHAQKTVRSGPHCWGWEDSSQFAHQLESAVTYPPLVWLCHLEPLPSIASRHTPYSLHSNLTLTYTPLILSSHITSHLTLTSYPHILPSILHSQHNLLSYHRNLPSNIILTSYNPILPSSITSHLTFLYHLPSCHYILSSKYNLLYHYNLLFNPTIPSSHFNLSLYAPIIPSHLTLTYQPPIWPFHLTHPS